jgi:hypothetical protein
MSLWAIYTNILVIAFFFHTLATYNQSQFRPAGHVLATHVEAVSRGRAFIADLVGMFGNKSELLTKKKLTMR